MVDWNSQENLIQSSTIFNALLYAFTGVYTWEWLLSLDFDLAYIRGKRPFRWPMIIYFANRYLMFGSLISLIVFFNSQSHPAACETIYRLCHTFGNVALGLASTNFAVRTICVWMQDRYVVVALSLLVMGQWVFTALVAHKVKATWLPEIGCLVEDANYLWLTVVLVYAIVFDFTVLVLNVYKMGIVPRQQRQSMRNFSVSYLLFKQGVVYFIVAFLANFVAVIMISVNLNIVMNGMFLIPSHTISTIAACRSVRILNTHLTEERKIYTASTSLPQSPRMLLNRRADKAFSLQPEETYITEECHDGTLRLQSPMSVFVKMETFQDSESDPRQAKAV